MAIRYFFFENLSMVADITKIKYQNSQIFNSVNLTIPGKVAKLNFVYIFILCMRDIITEDLRPYEFRYTHDIKYTFKLRLSQDQWFSSDTFR